MVEILCTTLTGMAWGHDTVEMYVESDPLSLTRKRRLGQTYIVMRSDACWPGKDYFQHRLQRMCEQVSAEPAAVPGERWQHRR